MFTYFWLLLGVFLIGMGILHSFVNKRKIIIPKPVSVIFYIIICTGCIILAITEFIIIKNGLQKPEPGADYVIVLGARVNGTKVSLNLKYRLDAALDYIKDNPGCKVIVSGGQGKGEDITEGKAMEDYLASQGLSRNQIIKEEKSDKSSDVIRAITGQLSRLGVEICLGQEVSGLMARDGQIQGIGLKKGERKVPADAVIVASGGLSYPSTGSTGDGYEFARSVGHKVTELSPALTPLEVREQTLVQDLQGLSLKNVRVQIWDGKKIRYEAFGEMLFTHFGVSGPVILSASSYVAKELKKRAMVLTVDLKPALDLEQLDSRILRDFEGMKQKMFKNALGLLLPSKLIPVIVGQSEIPPEKPVNAISRKERRQLAERIKNFRLTLTGLRGYREAIITQGGVSVKEINPKTMESKLIRGLHFAGEVLDLDGVTGGYNLQIAWSTGYLAGRSV